MHSFRARLLLLLPAALAGALGCGSHPANTPATPVTPVAPVTQVTPANLNGNWLLAGALPQEPGLIGTPQPFGFAATFTTQGSEIAGSGRITYSCGNIASGLSFGGLLKGSVAADGTFTATFAQSTSPAPQFAVSLTGSVPKTAGQPLIGTYALQLGPSSANDPCIFSQSGDFNATSLSNVSGTYTGVGTVGSGSAQTQVKITVQLAQGVSVTTAEGSTIDELLLSGSVRVEGSSCFTSGTIAPSALQPAKLGSGLAHVNGNEVSALFSMDDGAQLTVIGDFADQQGQRLVTPFLTVRGGSCGSSAPAVLHVTELDRMP